MIPRSLALAVIGLILKQVELVASQSQYVNWNVDERCPEDDRRMLQEPTEYLGDADTTHGLRRGAPPQDEDQAVNVHEFEEDSHRELFVGTTNPVTFNMKLYWQQGYCWQREWDERKWCLQCRGSTCDDWDLLWINECDQYDFRQRFEWVQLGINPTSKQYQGLLKLARHDLCVEQVIPNAFRLRPCDELSANQKLVGFHMSEQFQLRPFHEDHITECLTQDHHPKPYEELISEPCYVAKKHRTSYWEAYRPSERLVTLRLPACSSTLPCEECQGDCTRDTDCKGSLRCFQRGRDNAVQSIPGCAGVPLAHFADYCFDPIR